MEIAKANGIYHFLTGTIEIESIETINATVISQVVVYRLLSYTCIFRPATLVGLLPFVQNFRMEAAIAAMAAKVQFMPNSEGPNRKKKRTGSAGDDTDKKKKKKNKLTSENDGSKMFAKSIALANFKVSGTVCDDINVNKGVSAEAKAIRACFAAVMSLKLSIALSEKKASKTIAGLKFDALSNAIRSNQNLAHLMKVRNKLKNAKTQCAEIGVHVAMLRSLAMLDLLYMELLPLAASLRNKEERYLLLPDPAAYIACILPVAVGGEASSSDLESNRLARYLMLRKLEAEQLGLPALIAEVVETEGLSTMKSDNTMRGCCPMGTPTVRAWQDSCRCVEGGRGVGHGKIAAGV